MTDWHTALKRGFTRRYGVLIDGIPVAFTEPMEGVTSAALGVGTDGVIGSILAVEDFEGFSVDASASFAGSTIFTSGGGTAAIFRSCDGRNHSTGTGPRAPYAGSWFALTETTSPGYPNKTDYLTLTSAIAVPDDGSVCWLSVWYHAYGTAMGTMALEVEDQANPGVWVNVATPVNGSQTHTGYAATDPYDELTVDLSAYAGKSIKVRFFYTSGTSYTGDVGLDNFQIYTTLPRSKALAILPGQTVSQDLDREKGLASARAVTLVLGWDQLEEEGWLDALYENPTKETNLTADITSASTATFNVDSTAVFDAPGSGYVGREHILWTGKTGTTFDGITRGAADSLPHYHQSSTALGYKRVTDKPVYWVGRQVSFFEHLCDPAGHYLGSRLCDSSDTYCRRFWIGFVEDQPSPGTSGMEVRCLSTVRALDKNLGYKVQGKATYAQDLLWDWPDWFVRVGADSALTLTLETAAGVTTVTAPTGYEDTLVSFRAWTRKLEDEIKTALGANYWVHVSVVREATQLNIVVHATGGVGPFIGGAVDPRDVWFIPPGREEAYSLGADGYTASFSLTIDPGNRGTGWLLILLEDTDDWAAFTPDASGFLFVDADGKEVVSYDSAEAVPAASGDLWLVRITARNVGGGPGANPWKEGAKIQFVTGVVGWLGEAALTLLQSSGLGSRGAWDSLGLGRGYGLPDGFVDDESWRAYPLRSVHVPAVTSEEASFQDLLCGWLAGYQRCACVRQGSDGDARLSVVETVPVSWEAAQELGDAEVAMFGHAVPEMLEAPNEVEVKTQSLFEGVTHIARDVPRVQAEGSKRWKLKAPGASGARAVSFGASIIADSDGMATIQMEVAPFVDIQIGDVVDLTSAHPLVYDWDSGTRAPASVAGRVVGHSRDLHSGRVQVTLLLAGRAADAVYLCPSVVVTSIVSTTVLGVAAADIGRFVAGETVTRYTPGSDNSETTPVIDSIDTTLNRITFTGVHGASVNDIVTHAPNGSASVRQQTYFHVISTDRWR